MATLYVGASQTYKTVAEAVAAASAGDTVIIKGSEYTAADERVTVNKSLTLKAEGDVTMRGLNIGGTDFDLVVDGINFVAAEADASGATGYGNNASCISQTGMLRNVTIENCTFDLTNAGMTRTYGIFLSLGTWGFENLVVRNNVCEGYYDDTAYAGYGLIYAANVNNADVSNNTITYAASHAIQLSLTGKTYQGSGEQTIKIDGNIIDKSYACAVYCADLQNSDMTVEINDNVVSNVQEGSCSIYHGAIRIGQSTISGVEITGNVIDGAQVGIYNAAEIKEGSDGSIVIENNAMSVSQIHPAEDGVTPVVSGLGGTAIPEGTADNNVIVEDAEIPVDSSTDTVYVNNNWSAFPEGTAVVANGKVVVIGTNAFADVNSAAAKAETTAGKLVIVKGADVTYDANQWYLLNTPAKEIETDKWSYDYVVDASETYDLQIDGTLKAYQLLLNNAETVVSESGKLFATGEVLRVMGGSLSVEGVREANAGAPEEIFTGNWGIGTKPGADTQIKAGYIQINQGAVADFNNTVVFVNAGWMNFDNATAEFNNSYIYLGSGGSYAPIAVQIANGAEVTFADNTTIINDTEFTMNITVDAASTLIVSADSSIVATSLTVADGGKFIIDATGFSGVKKIVDLSGSESLEGKVTINGEGVSAVYGADGDVTLVNVDTSVLYVDSSFSGEYGTDLGDGKFMGINAFATTQEAYKAARNIGGEITIDLTGAGAESLGGTIGFGNAGNNGYYTITGGSVNTTSYGIYINNPMDITVKFDNATFKLAKLYVESANGELIVNNSVIGTAAYSGHGSGWVTALQGDIKITDSIFGMNFANYTEDEIKAMPRSASDVKAAVADGTYKYWAFGSNNSGPHMGTTDEISVTDSTLSATWISLIDRAEMNLNNSVLYYGAAISIGAGQVDSSLGQYDSNEIGWDAQIWWGNSPAASKDGFREGEVATMNITDSIVRNIGSGNGNAGAHVQVGGSVTYGNTPVVGQDFAGVLNLKNSEFYITPYDADGNAIAREYDFMAVKDNGTVNVEDSTLVTAKVINDGTVNVSGDSTLNITTLTGNAIQAADGATLTDSKVGGKVQMLGDLNFVGDNEIKTIAGANGGTLTVEDGKTLALNNFSFGDSNNNTAEYVITGGKITASYGFFQHGKYTLESDFETGYMYYSYGSDITVTGSFHSQGLGDGLDYVRGNLTIADGGKSIHDKSLWVGQPASWGEMTASLTVDAGGYVQAATLNVYAGSSASIAGAVKANTLENTGVITITAATGLIEAGSLSGDGTITIDATDFSGTKKVIDLSGTTSLEGKVTIENADGLTVIYGADGDVTITDASAETVYFDYNWAGKVAGTEVAAGKVIGVNAFAEFTDNGTNDKGWSNLLVLPEGTTEVVLTAGNENASYGMLRPTQSITVKTEGEGYAVIDRFVNMGCDLTFAEGSKVKVIGNVGLSGANNQGGTVTINGEVYMAIAPNNGNKALYLWGMNSTPGQLVINAGGILKADCANVENHGTITVYGTMELGKLGDAPKLAGVGANNGGWHGHLIVDGKDGEGIVSVAHNQLNFGGGNTSVDWQEPAGDCSVDIINGGKITTAAVSFRNGAKNTLTINNGTLEFTNDPDYANLTPRYFDNQGIINVTNGTLDMSNRNFDNTGSISIAGSSFTVGKLTGTRLNADDSALFNIKAAYDADGNAIATELNISNGFEQVIDVNRNSADGDKVILTGNVKASSTANSVIRTYGDVELSGFKENSEDKAAVGKLFTDGNIVIKDNSDININWFQVKGNGVIEEGSTVSAPNVNIYDHSKLGAVLFTVNGTLKADTLIITNSIYKEYYGTNVYEGDSNFVVGENGVIERATSGAAARFDLQLGQMTVYGYVNQKWDAAGGTGYIGNDGYSCTLTVDGTYAAADNNKGKFINSGTQKLEILEGSFLNVVNGGTFSWANAVKNDGAISIEGNFTVGETLTNNGSVTVTGESTVNIATLSGNYVKFEDATIVGDSVVGGNIRTFGNFEVAADFTTKQSNFYGTTTIKSGAVYTGSTTIVGGGSEFTLENGAKLNSRFFNVVGGTADIAGEIVLEHSDPRQKLLQIHEDGVANINEGAAVTINRHNAIVNAGGTLNVNGGSLIITADTVNVAPDRGGVIYNAGTVNVNGGLVDIKTLSNTSEVVVNGGTLDADNMDLLSSFKLDGLTAGDKRTITVAFMPEGSTEGGFTKQIEVGNGATSVEVKFTDIADGKYNLNIIDGTNVISSSVEIVNGTLDINGGKVQLGALNVNSGAANVYGESTVVIESQNGVVNVNDGAVMSDSKLGTVYAYGTSTWQGTNTIGNFSLGWYNAGADIVVNMTGTANVNNFMIYNSEGLTATLNIGSADGERTTINGNQHNYTTNSVVNVVNADVTGNYASMTGVVNITNSTYSKFGDFRVVAGGNTTIDPKVKLDNSSISGAYGYIGGWSASAAGYGVLELVNNSIWQSSGGSCATAKSTITLDNSDMIIGGTFTMYGSLTMDVDSMITFKGLDLGSTGTITIDMTDINNANGNKLFDYTGSNIAAWDMDAYKAIIGNWSDDMSKLFTVEDGDLVVKANAVVYVNGSYTDAANNQYKTLEEALASGAARIITTNDTISGAAGYNGAEAIIQGGTYNGTVSGGSITAGTDYKKDWVDTEGDYSLSISGGTFNKIVMGANRVNAGLSEHVGNVDMTISGGTFNQIVVGGMVYADSSANANRGQAILTGDVNLTISGGSFSKYIYGGNLSGKAEYAGCTMLDGNINITIDAVSAIDFKSGCTLVAGSYRNGEVWGDITVTVKGDGANLTMHDDFQIWGGCSSDVYLADADRTFQSSVSGDRTFVFDEFTGDFDARIRGFAAMEIVGGSEVNITKGNLNDIQDWTLEAGSMLTGNFDNNFAGDDLVIDLGEWSGDSCELMIGAESMFNGIESLASVNVGSDTLTFDGVSKWASASYELELKDGEDGKKVLAFSKLA